MGNCKGGDVWERRMKGDADALHRIDSKSDYVICMVVRKQEFQGVKHAHNTRDGLQHADTTTLRLKKQESPSPPSQGVGIVAHQGPRSQRGNLKKNVTNANENGRA